MAIEWMQSIRAAWASYRAAGNPDEAEDAARLLVHRLIEINARSAAVAVAAERSARLGAQARRRPGDLLAWRRAAVAALLLNYAADGFADPDFTALAGRHLDACMSLATEPDEYLEDVLTASTRADVLRLRYLARQFDAAGMPEQGRAHLEDALRAAAGDTFLEIVLTIELRRLDTAADMLERFSGDPLQLAVLNLRAGRAARAEQLLATINPATYREPAWVERGRRATIALARNRTDDAAGLAAEGIAAFEEWSAGLGRDYYRAAAADDNAVADIYHVALLAKLRQGDPATAFGLADRCRALSLRPLARGGDPQGVRAWQAAGAALAAVHERLAAEALRADPAKATGVESDVLAEMLAAEAAVDALEARLTPEDSAPAIERTLHEVQQTLAEDAALVLYHSFDQDLVIWAVRRDKVTVHHRSNDHRELIRAVRRLHRECADFHGIGVSPGDLAKKLIDPVAGALQGVRRLYVSAGGGLSLLPFAVLPVNGVPLGERFVLSMLPAAAVLTRPGATRPVPRDTPALLVGDPAYDRWPRLPGTGVEVTSIALPNRTVRTGTAATAAEVARLAPGCGIVHLATHGFVDELRPHLSRLALTGSDEITLPDLLRIGLRTDLLVLSACHTGRGRATATGDVLGLARAALAAGVRHLVVSLWPVDDESACQTMIALYERLAAGANVATALHDAQARIRDSAAYGGRVRDLSGDIGGGVNPVAHWAPFIHIGG